MSIEQVSLLRPVVVATLPAGAAQGDTCVLASNGHMHTFDGAAWIDNGAAGGGGAVVSARVTITPPPATRGQYTQSFAAPGVTPASNVFCSLVPNQNFDIDELDDLQIHAQPLTNSIRFTVTRRGPIGNNILVAYTVI